MKTKTGFNLRTVCGENIIGAEGIDNIDFSRIISLNESAAFLWKSIQGKDFNMNSLTQLLTDEYDVDAETARRDVDQLVARWKEAGLIESEED